MSATKVQKEPLRQALIKELEAGEVVPAAAPAN
jgi:hypothetical protein